MLVGIRFKSVHASFQKIENFRNLQVMLSTIK